MRYSSFGFTLIFKNEIMNNIIKNNQNDVGASCKAIVLVPILLTLSSSVTLTLNLFTEIQ